MVEGLDFYLDAFRELSTCRPSGLGLGAIPFTAIVEYSRIYELGDFDDFFYIIRKLDNTWIKLESEKSSAVKDTNASTNSNKTHQSKR